MPPRAVLGKSDVQEMMEPGVQELNFHVDEVDVEGLARHVLANVGLIKLELCAYDPPQVICSVGMVTQVTEENGELTRHVYNPLE